MKKLFGLILIVMLWALPAWATSESITVSNTAIGITAALIPSAADKCAGWGDQNAFCTVETDQVRFWVDGTTPTDAAGHLVNAGDVIRLNSCVEMYNFKMIRVTSDATVRCTYY